MKNQLNTIDPFVKWAGGKRQLLAEIKKRLPKKFLSYYEPFVGGGAVLFSLQPYPAVINDINSPLIHTYRQIQQNPQPLIEAVNCLDEEMWEDGSAYYYEKRQQFNQKLHLQELDTELAALFIFLNKHCFNGLYRVNAKGLFNVPYNQSRRKSLDPANIYAVSHYLKHVVILEGDFQTACANAQKGDFIFFDSPYAPLTPTSFESYTKEGFSIENHRRLADLFDTLTERGCYCMLTNHNTPFIHALYGNLGYRLDTVSVKRYINADGANRTGEEIIICNYA